ncbi:MAG: PIN domain-containing protein, partial [Gemmatimonadetes bacterium]|nr:PIN domain-containing protein [Gemmatimonadota bacterium]
MRAAAKLLLDSSVWIDYYRPGGRRDRREAIREALARDRVATTAMIVTEILQGASTAEDYEALREDFAALRGPPLARHHTAHLRDRRSVRVRPSPPGGARPRDRPHHRSGRPGTRLRTLAPRRTLRDDREGDAVHGTAARVGLSQGARPPAVARAV